MPNPFLRPAAGVLASLALVAIGLFVRRSAGATDGDLPIGEASVLAGLMTFGAGTALSAVGRAVAAVTPSVMTGGTLLIGLTFAAGATDEPVAFLAGSAVVAAATVICTWRPISTSAASPASALARPMSADETPAAVQVLCPADEPTGDDTGSDRESPGEFSSTLVRSRQGSEVVLRGRLAFSVPAGEQVHAVHVPLWPPLPSDPQVECDLAGLEGRVRVTLAKAYGLRVEIRLTEPVDEPLDGGLSFTARCGLREAGSQVAA